MHEHIKMMIYDFATEATKKAKQMDMRNPDETIAHCSYLQTEIKYIVEQALQKEKDANKDAIDQALQAAVEYGNEGAPHHMQYGTDLIVRALTHNDEGKYSEFKAEFKEQWNEDWNEGVAP